MYQMTIDVVIHSIRICDGQYLGLCQLLFDVVNINIQCYDNQSLYLGPIFYVVTPNDGWCDIQCVVICHPILYDAKPSI